MLSVCGTTGGGIVAVYDRIIHSGGLDGTSTGVQSVNTPTLPTDRGIASDYSDLEWYLESYVATGSPAQNATVVYLDQNGTTKTVANSTGLFVNSAPAQLKRIVQASGDTISSVTSIQLNGSTGTVGNFGVTCLRRISGGVSLLDKNSMSTLDFASTTLPRIYDNACLQLVGSAVNSVSTALRVLVLLVEGTL
jgi:hypothetical protein